MTQRNPPSPVWHPFTQHALEPVTKRIVKNGRPPILSMKMAARFWMRFPPWWVITHGHRYPRIMDAIRTALDTFDQIIFAEYTHEPAEELAKGLIPARSAWPSLMLFYFR